MNRLLSWLIVLGLTVGLSACDKKEGLPLPKTGAVENDVQEIKTKISDLKSKITKATGKLAQTVHAVVGGR